MLVSSQKQLAQITLSSAMNHFTKIAKRFGVGAIGSVDARAIIGVIAGVSMTAVLLIAGLWYLQRRCTRRYWKSLHNRLSTDATGSHVESTENMTPPPPYEPSPRKDKGMQLFETETTRAGRKAVSV